MRSWSSRPLRWDAAASDSMISLVRMFGLLWTRSGMPPNNNAEADTSH